MKTRITALLGIEHPIFQAAMSWASSNSALVIAVSNAGGMGVLAAGPLRLDDFRRILSEIRAGTRKPYGVNIPLNSPKARDMLDIAHEARIPVMVASQGGPREHLARFRAIGTKWLHVVANLLSRGAELRYGREFGVSLWEWRTVALLGGAKGAQSLNELARSAGIDKSHMSRVVSGLAARRLVLREPDPEDARGIRLTLSKTGQRLYGGLIRAASQRDAAFRSCLSRAETEAFDRALSKLAGQAREFIQREKGAR